MAIFQTDIRKDLTPQLGEPIYGPSVSTYADIRLVEVDNSIVAGIAGAVIWGAEYRDVWPVMGEYFDTNHGTTGWSPSSWGGLDGSTGTPVRLFASLTTDPDRGYVSASNGYTYTFVPSSWRPRLGRNSVTEHQFLINVEAPIIGVGPTILTNPPGWTGSAESNQFRMSNETFRYSFTPLSNVPTLTGLYHVASQNPGSPHLPTDYFAAFEISGYSAICQYDGQEVHGPFTWAENDRFHIFYANGWVRFFQNATELWSSF